MFHILKLSTQLQSINKDLHLCFIFRLLAEHASINIFNFQVFMHFISGCHFQKPECLNPSTWVYIIYTYIYIYTCTYTHTILSPSVLRKCFPVPLLSQNIFEIIFFDYFCLCYEGRRLGNKFGFFDHIKKTTSMTCEVEAVHFICRYFKSQPKDNLGRGGGRGQEKN